MMHSKWCGILLPLIIIVFTLWQPVAWVSWLVVAAGVLLLLHAFMCKTCIGDSCTDDKLVAKQPKIKK
jgi:hypothetical protein